MDSNKKSLKIPKGEMVNIKLESLTPFSEGENEWDGVKKKWFGYNLTKGSEEYVYFASDAVHKLFQEAKPEGEFSLELRSVNNKEGKLRSIWYLNGKNLWQYAEVGEEPASTTAPEPVVDTAPEPVASETETNPATDTWQDRIEERLDKLEKDVYSKLVKTDDEIPF